MKFLLVSGIAAAVLLASAATMLRSHAPSADLRVNTAGMMSMQDMHAAANVKKLPIEDFEDKSETYSSATKP